MKEQSDKRDAIDELRCSLSTIAGLAKTGGTNALHDIACTALAGVERLKLMAKETTPSTTACSEQDQRFKNAAENGDIPTMLRLWSARSATPQKPDGYAVVLDDKSSPVGYWFAYAYIEAEMAEKAAGVTKGRVVPIYFEPAPRDEEGWLVEAKHNDLTQWWSGGPLPWENFGTPTWTRDAFEAVRFCRERDGQRAILDWPAWMQREVKVTGHRFLNRADGTAKP